MRNKSENEARDRFARRFAAVLAVDAMIRWRAKTATITIIVEAEDNPLWDDIVQAFEGSKVQHRFQVKRQLTALASADFAEYIRAAANGDTDTHYHFCFPSLVEVVDTGELRVLHGLCKRLQQTGSDHRLVIKNLRPAERKWVDALRTWTELGELSVTKLLRRIHFEMIGVEEDLDNRALRSLEVIFGTQTEQAWKKVCEFVADKDGVVRITPGVLWAQMPTPASSEIDTFYWSYIEEVEEQFDLKHWEWATDHLVRNLIPLEFHDGVLRFIQSINETVWPGNHPEIETALKSLAERANRYIVHFNSRSELNGNWVRENLDYKRIFPNPNYDEELDAAKAWDKEGTTRLADMVVALNLLFESVRRVLKPTYRLRDGKLGIHDSLGIRNRLVGAIYYPRRYSDE